MSELQSLSRPLSEPCLSPLAPLESIQTRPHLISTPRGDLLVVTLSGRVLTSGVWVVLDPRTERVGKGVDVASDTFS
jgi:hypothetical protein